MKIIGIRNGNGRELPQQVYLISDSAVIKTNKPFFLPHFAQGFKAKAAIALHIDRLGKHIAQRFAHRYCMAIAPAIKVTAQEIDYKQENEQFSALANSFDGALLLGDFIPVDSNNTINDSTISVEYNGEVKAGASLTSTGVDFKQLIEHISKYFTLKMGDVILVELNSYEFNIKIGDVINALCNQSQLLTIRVK